MLCVRMYAVCRSHLCIVNVREYEVQDTFPLHVQGLCDFHLLDPQAKNTVCLLLKFRPPNTNPLLIIE